VILRVTHRRQKPLESTFHAIAELPSITDYMDLNTSRETASYAAAQEL
jgi:hypothetical protein